jgi:hypothetical protein
MTTATIEADVQSVKSKGAKVVDITGQLAKSIAFVVVSVHMWRGQYHIKGAKVEVSGEELSEKLTTKPRWHLMPPKWRERFTNVESKLKACINRARILNPDTDDDDVGELLRFPVRGISIIPRSRLINLFDELDKIEKGEWQAAIETFEQDWPQVVEWARSEVKDHPPEVWNVIRGFLPTSPKAAAERFFIDKIVIPIKLDGSTDLEYLTGKDAQQYIGKMKEYGQNFTKRVADTIIVGLQDELNNAVDTLVNRVGDGGVIKNSNLLAVKNVFEKYRAFDFLMTDDIQQQMGSLAQQLGEYDCSDLNKDLKESGAQSVTIKLAEHLKQVRLQCADHTAVMRAHGRGKRTIKV